MYPPDFGDGPVYDWPAIITSRQNPNPWLPGDAERGRYIENPHHPCRWSCWLCQGHRFQGKRFRFVTELYEHVFSEHWDKGEVFRNNPRYYPRCDQCCEYVHDSSCAHPRDFQCHHQGFLNVSSTLADEPFATLGEVMVHYTAFHPPEIAGQAHWMYVNRDTWPPPDIHDE